LIIFIIPYVLHYVVSEMVRVVDLNNASSIPFGGQAKSSLFGFFKLYEPVTQIFRKAKKNFFFRFSFVFLNIVSFLFVSCFQKYFSFRFVSRNNINTVSFRFISFFNPCFRYSSTLSFSTFASLKNIRIFLNIFCNTSFEIRP
jgi:hypothetical protein